MTSTSRFVAATAALACAVLAPAAFAATPISHPTSVTVTNEPVSIPFKALAIFPTDAFGELMPGVFFDTSVTPQVVIGDETSVTPRTIEGFQFFVSDQGLRFNFANADPWAPGEQLTFKFSVLHKPGVSFMYDLQFTPVPAPGPLALGAAAALVLTRRRRA